MKIAIYCRTSTEEQHPENQLLELREYCKRQGYEIYKEYIDQISGIKESRPALDMLMQDARLKYFDIVIVWKLDRLGRSLSHLIQVIQEWKNKKIDFICTTQGIDTTTSTGQFIFHIFGAIAQFEREMITERIRLGIKRRKAEGKPLGRLKGAKDSVPRKRLGYYERWANRKSTLPIPILDSNYKNNINKE